MKQLSLLATLIGFVLALTTKTAHAAGGILRNGEVLSIGSSGVQISLSPLDINDLPELRTAAQGLKRLSLPLDVRGQVLFALRPSASRSFFRVNHISEAEERALVEEYRKIMPELPSNSRFTLLALTDNDKRETYLLPSYFQLTRTSQKAAVLFDEALQVTGLVSSRKAMMELETRMETALNCSDLCDSAWDDLQIKFATHVTGDLSNIIFMTMLQNAAVADGASGQLSGIIAKNGDLNLSALLGSELMALLTAAETESTGNHISTISASYRESRVDDLSEKWPNSRFLKVLANCPFDLALVRANVETRTVHSDDITTKPTDTRLTSIVNWGYRDLRVKFSLKPLANALEVNAYFLNYSFPTLNSASSLQAVDVNHDTHLRKVYVLRGPIEKYDDGCGWGICDNGWQREYRYNLFAFALQ